LVKIRLSARVTAPIEDVYQYVTAFGENGLLDVDRVAERYADNMHQDGEYYVYTEDVRMHIDNPEQIITWRCSFDYPKSRTMRAVDSNWSHRTDFFQPDRDFTYWTVQWDIQDSFIKSMIKWFVYKIGTHRVLKRRILNPVIEHFAKDFE
jgi:hypothetical protein